MFLFLPFLFVTLFHLAINSKEGGGDGTKKIISCYEFISETIGRIFLMILFHHLTNIGSYVRINDRTKGRNRPR